jgi:SAM-dependent methyltransferase
MRKLLRALRGEDPEGAKPATETSTAIATGADDATQARPTPASATGRAPTYQGHCCVCGQTTTFRDVARPIRETYPCTNCNASMRERVTASAILAAYGEARFSSLKDLAASDRFSGLKIYEPGVAGSYRRFLKPLPGYQTSFYWEGGVSGEPMNGVRHEDLMNLSFADESFDLVISSDIFEHIRDPWVAFREVARILRRGGMHIFSIPAQRPMPAKTFQRVDISGPEDKYIVEPHYHGDGRGGRSLVYTDFGADFIGVLRQSGFLTLAISDDHTDAERLKVVAFVSIKV